MSLVSIPDELKHRLDTAAAARGITAEQLAAEVLTAAIPASNDARPPTAALSFIAIGNSGRPDLGTRHHDIRRELANGLTANDV